MGHNNGLLARILSNLDLGSSVAEQDTILQTAKVETSVFSDLLNDKVDLIPGTKGSGKSALYRIFVDWLAPMLLEKRKLVLAHGVQSHGDPVFHAFKNEFEKLSESDFVDFWCIYLVSLAHEHFIKKPEFAKELEGCEDEIEEFRKSCYLAGIPEIKAAKTLREVLQWVLNSIPQIRPKISCKPDSNKFELEIFGEPKKHEAAAGSPNAQRALPKYFHHVKSDLEKILLRSKLQLWLMIDRLDEIFPRRTELETRALRGLLRTSRLFESKEIRVKIFLRDDILDQITDTKDGFTALTHLTARQADKLRWSEEQILKLVVKRLFTSKELCHLLNIDPKTLDSASEYQQEAFYRVFPPTVHTGQNQSSTLRWIYNHTMDGRGVVTPRDVIDLLTHAKQHQQDQFGADSGGTSEWVIGPDAVIYGLEELSLHKRDTYLKAEFPHFWPHIQKFKKGKTEYSEEALARLLGKQGKKIRDDLISIGVLRQTQRKGVPSYKIPFVYWKGLELIRGTAD
jgi:hypothetical protein